MDNDKYTYAREIIYSLRTCNAITDKVYQHWLDKINKDEKESK